MNPETVPRRLYETQCRDYESLLQTTARVIRERDTQRQLAGELIAAIRINMLRETFASSTPEQVDAWLKSFSERLLLL